MTTKDPIEVVEQFFAHFGPTWEELIGSFDVFFTPQTVWENVGVAVTTGIDEAKAFTQSFPIEFEYMSVEVLHMAAVGNVVMTERIDHFHDKAGHIVFSIRVAGTFEIENGRIVHWRDYFDTSRLAAG